MSLKLTWDDLLIQGFTPEQAVPWLREWDWLVTGKVAPIFMSKFGNWFLLRPDNTVELLDVLEGTLTTIASSAEEFRERVNHQAWQEENLLSLMIYHLHEEGKIPGPLECYAFAPHPRLTGAIKREQVIILSIFVWQNICSQLCR